MGTLGQRIRRVLSAVVAKHRTQLLKVVTTLGSPENTGIASYIVSEASQVLAEMLGVHSDPIPAGVRHDLLDALVAQAGDPDTAVPEWFRSGAPMGIVRHIQACGVFPPSDGLETPRSTVQSVEITPMQAGVMKNYASFYEHEAAASAEMEIEIKKGFVVWEPSRATLEAKVGSLVPSRVAALVKEKPGGLKVRLIHDLRRSGVNATASIPERVVLPRFIDAVESIVKVAAADKARQGVDLAVLDFADAFKQLPVHLSEQRFLSGKMSRGGAEGWSHYRTVLFGAIADPLLWGRVAALFMRITASLTRCGQTALQCCVDDPLLGFRGTQAARDEMFAIIVLLWSVLGFKLSWRKGARGTSIEWIGAKIALVALESVVTAVSVTIKPEKSREVSNVAEEFLKCKLVDRHDLRQFAGLCSWVGSVTPTTKPYSQMLWAATSSRPAAVEGIDPAPHIHEQMATANYVQMATTLRTPSRITTSRLSTMR